MKRMTGNPVGQLASWLRQNQDVPGAKEALSKYMKKIGFSDEEFKHASAIRESAEIKAGISGGMKKPKPGLYFKESTNIVYRVEKGGNQCSWREHNREWWSKNGDMVQLITDYNFGKVVELTGELASRLGIENGICVVCGKTLTTKKSKEIGMGPVCVKTLKEYEEHQS